MLKTVKVKAIITTLAVILCVAAFILCAVFADRGLFEFRKNLKNSSDADFVKVIDVGQGDSILIHSNGYSVLIDTGPNESKLELSKALYQEGIEIIDILILTHLHIDHTGGVEQIFRDFKVENLILPELSTFSEGIYSAEMAIDNVTRSGGNIYKGTEGMNFTVGDFFFEIIGAYYDIFEENNRSLIIKAETSGKSFLFMGDAETKTEKRLIEDKKNLKCDVLKAGHHGSNSSTTGDFLKLAQPQYAVISVGKDNIYNHPHLSTLKQFEIAGIKSYRTDYKGDITFLIENGEIKVKTEK